MGYTTDFYGEFDIEPQLKPEHIAYLKAFNATRRMARNVALTQLRDDPIRIAAGLPLGTDGEYFVDGGGFMGQEDTPDVTDHNKGGGEQPGVWCQWVPNDDGTALEWDGNEKFYHYEEWLRYLLKHFFARWGYTLNGSVIWEGEDSDDRGKLVISDNELSVRQGYVVYEGEGMPGGLT